MKSLSLEDLIQKLDGKKQEQGLKFAKRINNTYVPRKEKYIIKLGDSVICSMGYAMLVIAPPGTGKSKFCEAVAAGAANPKCDALGLTVNSLKTLLVDTERVENDIHRGYNGIKNRAGFSDDEINKVIHVYSFMEAETVEQMKSELEHLVATGNYELVIIDGSADFVKSVNDEEESKSFWRWITKLAHKHEFGMVITIHPNPGDAEGKATGHLGTQGQKKAESVFNVFKSVDDKSIRVLTTESAHGKVRNAKDNLTASFTWDQEQGMFVSCDRPVSRKIKRIKDIFNGERLTFTYKELCNAWIEATGKSLTDAKRKIKEAKEMEEIVEMMGLYSLNGVMEIREDEVMIGGMVMDEEDDVPF